MSSRLLTAALALVLVAGCTGSKEQSGGTRGADFYYGLAVNFYYDQDAQSAIRELQTCFAKEPNHLQGHNLAGLIYLGRKEYLDSLKHFEKAMEIDPQFHMARANLGALHMAMQNWEAALTTLKPLLHERLYETPYLVENNIGWCYYNLKNFAEAERHLKRALFLNDKLCLAYNNLGILHADQEREDDALDNFDAAIERCPNFTEAYFHLGTVLEKKGQFAEAAKRFQKCQKLGKDGLFGRRCKRKLQVLK